jgi:hypothetical protein
MRCYWTYVDIWMRVILQTWCRIQRPSSSLRNVNLWSAHIQFNNSFACSGLNIQQKVSALLLEISRQFNARYTANLMPNIAHIPQFTLCEMWPRTYAMYLQLRIFRLQYSTERICAAIGDMSTIPRALYCNLGDNTAHNLQFTQCELWSRPCTMSLQSHIFRLQ